MDEGLYHIHCDIQIYVWYCFFGFVLWNPFFFLTSMSVENHANMAASYPSSTSPPHHSHFPSTFPHAHPYLTHVPSLLQWAEIHPAPPASSSAASTPRTAPAAPSIFVTATNFCPPDYALPSDNGGWCNSPCPHFNLAMLVFLKIAGYRAGIVPVAFRRVPC
ncbi:hypothetical protein VitviT2T_028217 [Vitis vinifera]|uniref:Expansin n=1 Tax=Vitis vinifera TaxID=29760 RepID=A0ABY9DSC2_VITVI|nr:hypothetical protein VitviT2T_028217 [Vitis vinifera]